ncbi:GAD-like domain-containing protein [Pseudomonas sp. PSKL.D1]|uniref:GAD-like domain-containing protein n=1 Tax=Pseudomonas sp. PSKL.D1 TaxID=3029060 RepID=UPI002381237B|nr:GAD-like domain-containing protein [Pseudomonas sp. PSKL.D1]WDY56095.1 GAD-like domain-containing protein [Pseudomonas sp. PSKL.D1]
MDEAFALFLETMDGPLCRQEVPPSSIERYKGKLPAQLLAYWQEHGWCGYADGLFWTVNPQEYEGVVEAWIGGTPLGSRDTYHLIARSAFGDLYLFGEQTGFSLKIVGYLGCYVGSNRKVVNMDRHVQNFFVMRDREADDFDDLFEPVKKKLGGLRYDEVYAFVPAMTLGGSGGLESAEKVKAMEHLVLLSQISALKPYSFSDF